MTSIWNDPKSLELEQMYTSGTTDYAVLADHFDTSTKSVIAKLSSLGLLVRNKYTSVYPVPLSKAQIVRQLELLLDTDLPTLDKCNKLVLCDIYEQFTP
jgi:hypothetical protein